MVGRDLKDVFPPKAMHLREKVAFSISIKFLGKDKLISFCVREGEVLGIGGLQGQGQIKLLEAIFGLESVEELSMTMNGEAFSISNQADAVKAKIALIPENRGEQGVFLGASVYENLASATLDSRSMLGFIKKRAEKSEVVRMVQELSIKINSDYQVASSLSGGNMQKLVIGKWLMGSPSVIILLEPTKGVDVGTKQQIYQIIRDLANRNTAVIIYTSDMLELIGVSDRVLVMSNSRFTAEYSGSDITEENIMKGAVSLFDINGDEIRS
jgi:ABC-type sugar transport system ATPase subunit